jgi:hypothetical protein
MLPGTFDASRLISPVRVEAVIPSFFDEILNLWDRQDRDLLFTGIAEVCSSDIDGIEEHL